MKKRFFYLGKKLQRNTGSVGLGTYFQKTGNDHGGIYIL